MTNKEICKIAKETTDSQFENIYNGFSEEDLKSYLILIKLGYEKKVALWTVIFKKYKYDEDSKVYKLIHVC